MNRSNIEEANKHLQALYGRVEELEHVVAEQQEALVSKDSFIQTKIAELSQQDARIHRLTLQLKEKENVIRDQEQRLDELKTQLNNREHEVSKLKKQKLTLDKISDIIPDFKTAFSRLEVVITELDETCSESKDQDDNRTSTNSVDDADATDSVSNKDDLSDSGNIFVQDGESTTQQILRSFSRNERLEKFSISEDDDINKGDDIITTKELYF